MRVAIAGGETVAPIPRRRRRLALGGLGGVIILLVLVLAPRYGRGEVRSMMFRDVATPAMADRTGDSQGVCWADYDQDGDQDVFVARAVRRADEMPHLWRNDRHRFSEAPMVVGRTFSGSMRAVGCAFADIDSDGDLDLYITSESHRRRTRGPKSLESKLFLNNGDGTFTDITDKAGVAMRGVGSASSDWADFDGDGDLDAFVAARNREELNALFQQARPLVFRDVATQTRLADPVGHRYTFLGSWFDYDADGDVDLLLAIDFWGLELYRNDEGAFARVTGLAFPPATDSTPGAPPNNPMGVTWGDYDNDGCIDVFVTGMNLPGQGGFGVDALGDLASRLYRSNCDGTFADVTRDVGFVPTGLIEWSASFIDFDNDGDLDLSVVAGNAADTLPPGLRRVRGPSRKFISLIVNVMRRLVPDEWVAWAYRYEVMIPASGSMGRAAAMPNLLYQNMLVESQLSRYVDVTDRAGVRSVGSSRGSAWADMDNDGDLDWFIAGRGTPNRLFRNDGSVGNYLQVHLVGRRLKDAVGAWVRVTTRGELRPVSQVRPVRVLDGYLSQSQMDPHFGLGRAGVVDEIAVRWPGRTDWVVACAGVPANRSVTIKENGGCTWDP